MDTSVNGGGDVMILMTVRRRHRLLAKGLDNTDLKGRADDMIPTRTRAAVKPNDIESRGKILRLTTGGHKDPRSNPNGVVTVPLTTTVKAKTKATLKE